MNDTNESNRQASAPGLAPRWLLLIAQLPPKPDYLRVKLRRRVQRIGAIAIRSSVFALPNQESSMEDFEWLRTELLADGAQAMICASTPIAGLTDDELEERFRAARNEEYDRLADEACRGTSGTPDERPRVVGRLRKRLAEIDAVDFFGAPSRETARRAIEELAAEGAESRESAAFATPSAGRTWVTRERVFVYRIASAWLIRRFIDGAATFKFVAAQGYVPQAGELRFDMFDAEYSHEGDRCTFETLVARFGLEDPALTAVGEIVHDVDCKDGKFGRPEAQGVESILSGLVRGEPDDARRIELGSTIFEALHTQLGGGS